ncbi:DUF7546 family protein [Halorarius litoreus]|uniref:DUF7546 family protein n=1 Tax=Halorarius litoreus TaxID=2962676 RepID=UPI0020CE7672|nr:hypothetical protein [Halorarius litoreus]
MSTVDALRVDLPRDWPLWVGILAVEALALGTYLLTVGGVSRLRYVLYPFVWINVGLFVLLRASSPAGERSFVGVIAGFLSVDGDLAAADHRRAVAALVAVAYGLVLAVVTGLVGLPLGAHAGEHAHLAGFQLSLSAPGWGPRLAYVVGDYHLYFVPYRVVGYAALSYLLYTRLSALSLASGAGVVGLLSCVGCAFPLVTSVFAGASAATLSAVTGYSLDLSTAAFLVAVAALWWPARR